jgi:hypothetical protein
MTEGYFSRTQSKQRGAQFRRAPRAITRPRVAAFGAQGFEKADSSFRIDGEIVARRGAGLAVTVWV